MELNRGLRDADITVPVSYEEMTKAFARYEETFAGSGEHMKGMLTFTKESFPTDLPKEARTYTLSSADFADGAPPGQRAVYGVCQEGDEAPFRLDGFLAGENGGTHAWGIESCVLATRNPQCVDIIAGPFFLCDGSGDRFESLSEAQMRRCREAFRLPEQFFSVDGTILAKTVSQPLRQTEMER